MPADPFSVRVRPDREAVVVAVAGDLDIATVPAVREVVDEAVDDGWATIVLDLRELTFMDSSGVHLMLELRDLASRGVQCYVIDGIPAVQRVLALAGTPAVLPTLEAHRLDELA